LSATGEGMAALKIKSSWEGILRPSYFRLPFFFDLRFLCLAAFLVSGPGRCSPRLSQNRT
jgi:hypothetical protein